ncbi:DUF3099 domain-containing protein [Cryobacterium melibiosiphilum]|uniref:DUF3099 domain-containing protein n=1 Tax=Cryobacterium melibiosiphilum TaxID=995039 RepID=A0A3A5MAL9_9MICO|nr:DUF3099 domain-containing protein [Cryobacterium melibiosiphilum]RJT87167.1 DUF3099 domain-containing protein [Cryobacterium melibiosiphilum]
MKQQSITSLPMSPEEERRRRMIKYSLAMGVRVICILLMLVAQGWWLLVCAIGAIVLPYVAVVIANVQVSPPQAPVLRPGGVELYRGDDTGTTGQGGTTQHGYDASSDTGEIYRPESGT